jgi:hypothetical protein
MSAQSPDSDPVAATPQATPFDTILAQCRDLVCGRLDQALAGMLDKVDDALSALISETRDPKMQKIYAQARDKALTQREAIEKQFRARYLREFQQRSNRVKKIGDSFAEIDLSSLELELVGDDDLDETLMFNAMATKLRQYCDEELIALDQRVGVLLGDASLQAEDNPLTPQAICDAYKDTCRQLDSNVEVRMVLLRLFDDHVLDDIRAVYKAVNALLVQNSILPKIRISARKEGGKAPSSGAAAEAPRAIAQAEPKASGGEQDLFSLLRNLRTSNLNATTQTGAAGGTGAPMQGTAAMPGIAPVAGMTGAGGGGDGMQAALQGTELLGLLTRIQLGDISGVTGNILPMATSAGEPGMTNVLRELKGTSVGTGMNQLDMMTLDIMSLVFDQLFDDPKIPVGVKGLIGRLQIPMLKVAIADKTFFSKKTHPARQLLDTLGEISLRLPADFNASSPLFRRLETILQELIDGFEDNMEIFDVARGRLETLIAEEDKRVEQETLSAANQIEQKERLALAKTVAQAEIKARVRTGNLPLPVLEFLVQQWVLHLLFVQVKDGEHSDAWKSALETMDLLIWSVEPKNTVDERRELATIVPELLKRLSEGLQMAGVEDAVRRSFFADLRKLHTELIGKLRSDKAAVTDDASRANDTAISDFEPAMQPPPVPVVELAPAPAAESTSVPALEFTPAPGAEPAPVPVLKITPAPAAEPIFLPDLEFKPSSAAEIPPVPVPAAEPMFLPDLEYRPEPAAETAPVPVPAAEPMFLPDLEYRPEPVAKTAPGPAVNQAPPPDLEAAPTFVAETAPASAAEFASLPVLKFSLEPDAKPASTPAAQPASAPAAKPAPAPAAQPPSTPAAKAASAPTAQPAAMPAAKPGPAPTAQPASTPAAKAAPGPGAAQPATTPAAKPGPVPTAKPEVPLPAAKVAPATAAQPASTSAAKPAPAPTAKPIPPPTAKASPAPAAKPTHAPEQGVRPVPTSPGTPRTPIQAKAANSDSLGFTAAITVQNPFGDGKVQVDDLDFTVLLGAGTPSAKSEATPAELPGNLKVGTWVGIRDKGEKDTRRSAKLSFISPLKTRYLFVDRHGKASLDCSRAELSRRFQLGEVVIMDQVPEVPLFDRITEGLVGKLGGSKALK